MVGIYKITSPSLRVYIGQSWDIKQRFSHYKHLRCADQPALFNSLKKYGSKSHLFEIVCELPSDIDQTVLDTYEILYWQQYIDCGFKMLNAKVPGIGGKHFPETKRKMSERLMGHKAFNEGMKMDPEIIKKRTEDRFRKYDGTYGPTGGRIAFKYSEESKKKMSETRKNSGMYVGAKNPNFGRKWTDEMKKKASETAILNNQRRKLLFN